MLHARSYNSVKEYLKDEQEHAANGERAINHYPIDAKPAAFESWGEFSRVAFRGFAVGVGLCVAGFVVFCVVRFLWNMVMHGHA